MAYLNTSGLSIHVYFPTKFIAMGQETALHGTGAQVELLFWANLYRTRERLLFSVFMWRIFIVNPTHCKSRGFCPRPGETAPEVRQESGACGRKIPMAEGNTLSSGRTRNALPVWKGCACAGAKPAPTQSSRLISLLCPGVSAHPSFYSHFTK